MANILIVDDDADILALVARVVRKQGHQVARAYSGLEALERVDELGAPDLAVLDVAMPGMDGLQLLQKLRAREGMARMPAVFLSARVQEDDVEAGRALGAEYLTKPFLASALRLKIERMLSTDDEGAW